MATATATRGGLPPPPTRYIIPIDVDKYGLDEEESAFFKETGITDDEKLKQHIVAVQAEAFAIYPYPCIRRFAFTKLKISRLPAYQNFLKLGREREGAIFLDIGCCFGNDVHKAIADGWPIQNAIASDLQQGFWDLGHKLFRTTPKTFPVPFIHGDIFSPALLQLTAPFTAASPPGTPAPDLRTLTSLTPLQGHVSAIHASSFFHLFDEAHQAELAYLLAGLLSPAPGTMIFGQHSALPEKGVRVGPKHVDKGMFCHSPASWAELWDGGVFAKGTVKVETELKEVRREEWEDKLPGQKHYQLSYSVTRLEV